MMPIPLIGNPVSEEALLIPFLDTAVKKQLSDVKIVETALSEVNESMLSINDRVGFKHSHTERSYLFRIEHIR